MSEDRWVRIVDPKHILRVGIDEEWHPAYGTYGWKSEIIIDGTTVGACAAYKVRCRLRDVPHGTKIVDPGEGYELVEPWEIDSPGVPDYWNSLTQSWEKRAVPQDVLSSTDIYRRPIVKPVRKTPQPGEWWFSNDRPGRAYIHGFSKSGTPIYELDTGSVYTSANWSLWHHEPACTGWDWQPPQPGAEPEPLTLEQRVEAMEQRLKKLEYQVSELEDCQ